MLFRTDYFIKVSAIMVFMARTYEDYKLKKEDHEMLKALL